MKSLKHLSLCGAVVAAVSLLSGTQNVSAAFVDLGQAAGYAAFILPGGTIDMTIKGGSAVNGDVAASAGTHIDLGSGAKVGVTAGTDQVVSGKIYLDTVSNPANPATVKLDGQDPNSVVNRDLTQAISDAISASNFATGLATTQNLGSLDIANPFTITGNGGLNVISLGDLILHGSGQLTLQGTASDYFVFNITGNMNMSSKSGMTLTGGLTAQNILWNFVGSGPSANLHSAGEAFGTFLAINRDFSIDDIVVNGAIISQGHLAIGSKALIIQPVPEVTPASVIFGFLGLVVAVSSRRALAGRVGAMIARK